MIAYVRQKKWQEKQHKLRAELKRWKALAMKRAKALRVARMNRQKAWQKEQIGLGNCPQCGKKNDNKPRRICVKCMKKQRKRTGHKPWRKGGVGRPPGRRSHYHA